MHEAIPVPPFATTRRPLSATTYKQDGPWFQNSDVAGRSIRYRGRSGLVRELLLLELPLLGVVRALHSTASAAAFVLAVDLLRAPAAAIAVSIRREQPLASARACSGNEVPCHWNRSCDYGWMCAVSALELAATSQIPQQARAGLRHATVSQPNHTT